MFVYVVLMSRYCSGTDSEERKRSCYISVFSILAILNHSSVISLPPSSIHISTNFAQSCSLSLNLSPCVLIGCFNHLIDHSVTTESGISGFNRRHPIWTVVQPRSPAFDPFWSHPPCHFRRLECLTTREGFVGE